MMNFSELCQHCQGDALQTNDAKAGIRFLLSDSRKAVPPHAAVFFAIRGQRHDGHDFLGDMYDKGCRQFVVEQPPAMALPGANICRVDDTLRALQRLAAAHRRQFDYPVIAISGSNGKTITKEWLSSLLSRQRAVVKSPRSYNSQLGVPLSLWQMGKEHELALIEAGISQVGEMQHLQPIIRPELGIFTNLGPAHDEGFASRQQKAQEMAKLFRHCKKIIYRRDYAEVRQVLEGKHKLSQLLSWSTRGAASYRVSYAAAGRYQTTISISGHMQAYEFIFPLSDQASLENITHVILMLLHLGWQAVDIQSGLRGIRPVGMRLEQKEGINGCYLLDDSYSNDLAGLQIALDQLAQLPRRKGMRLILSDMLKSGQKPTALYRQLADLLRDYPVSHFTGIGPEISRQQDIFARAFHYSAFFPDTESFLRTFDKQQFQQENILVKGARSFGFERIVRRLQQKIHHTTLEIRLNALTHNLNYFRGMLREHTRLMVMVKAFSYGGAAYEIANLLQFHRVDYLAVAYADEGVQLRDNGIYIPILVLNPSAESFELLQEKRLEPQMYSLSLLRAFIRHFEGQTEVPPLQLMLDTGMHRLGFQPEDMPELLQLLSAHPWLRITAVLSHLVASEDEAEDDFTRQQAGLFQQMYEEIANTSGHRPLRHLLNSAGISRFPEYQMDMVRLGIGLYGVDPSATGRSHLQPISRLRTVISQIRHLQAGETVGYNRRGRVERPSTIATLAIGYADGLDRRLGNGQLRVWVNGCFAPTIGNICMDMCMIDISGIEAREGDEVVIFGEEQPVSVVAEAMQTIPYEVLTGISERVKRVFYSE
jgi:alanine racemase